MRCILMSGLPASGKSTVARQLSEMFGYPLLSKDRLKEILFDNVGFDSHESKRKLDRASTYTMYYIADMLMSNKSPLILDNNFENATSKEIGDILDKHGYIAVTVRLQGDMDVFIDRYNRRNGTDERHRGHSLNTRYPEGDMKEEVALATKETFKSYIERGMDSFCIGKSINIDTTDLGSVDYAELFKAINNLFEESGA